MKSFIDLMIVLTSFFLVLGPRRKPVLFLACVLSATAMYELIILFLVKPGILPDIPLAHNIIMGQLVIAWVLTPFYYYRSSKNNGRQLTDTDFY